MTEPQRVFKDETIVIPKEVWDRIDAIKKPVATESGPLELSTDMKMVVALLKKFPGLSMHDIHRNLGWSDDRLTTNSRRVFINRMVRDGYLRFERKLTCDANGRLRHTRNVYYLGDRAKHIKVK